MNNRPNSKILLDSLRLRHSGRSVSRSALSCAQVHNNRFERALETLHDITSVAETSYWGIVISIETLLMPEKPELATALPIA